jgi:hypothetical protein
MSRLRLKSTSYANATATLALVIALGGGTAWAASHYLITSTKQIKPRVLRQLHGRQGRRGPRGPRGLQGLAGAPGTSGKNGADGKNGSNGKAGKNGTGPGYALSVAANSSLTVPIGSQATIVSKAVPAGAYLVHANVELRVTDSYTSYTDAPFELRCLLLDNGSTVDTSDWWGTTDLELAKYVTTAYSTIPLDAAVSAGTTNALTVECENLDSLAPGTVTTVAYNAALTAEQTTSNS